MAFANKFAQPCANCGEMVAKGEGFTYRGKGGWKVYHPKDQCGEPVADFDFSGITLDKHQRAVHAAVQFGVIGPHILTKARAGSGKTTVKCMSISDLYRGEGSHLTILALAFSTEDGKRLREKLPSGVQGSTTHSLCMSIVRQTYKGAKLNNRKDWELLDVIVGPDDHYESLRGFVGDLVAKAKADALLADDIDGIRALDKSYELSIPEDQLDDAAVLAGKMLEYSLDLKKWGFNFDDCLWLVVIRDLPLPPADFVGVDECQDWNECQLRLLATFVKNGARVLAVGDPEQSLYAFRGARHDAFERVKRVLEASDRGVQEYPMPISYRSSRSVIELAQSIVPDIQHRPDAPLGIVDLSFPITGLVDEIKPDDMAVSRNNAPLVSFARLLMLMGRPFYMRGGKQEAAILKWYVGMWAKGGDDSNTATDDPCEMVNRAQQWIDGRAQKTSPYKLAEHKERLEVVQLIAESCMDVEAVCKQIDKIFVPPRSTKGCIILSTIHRAKGSEAPRVFHIMPQLLPHPKATTEEQQKQESNACYVAITRAISDYYECVGDIAELRSCDESEALQAA